MSQLQDGLPDPSLNQDSSVDPVAPQQGGRALNLPFHTHHQPVQGPSGEDAEIPGEFPTHEQILSSGRRNAVDHGRLGLDALTRETAESRVEDSFDNLYDGDHESNAASPSYHPSPAPPYEGPGEDDAAEQTPWDDLEEMNRRLDLGLAPFDHPTDADDGHVNSDISPANLSAGNELLTVFEILDERVDENGRTVYRVRAEQCGAGLCGYGCNHVFEVEAHQIPSTLLQIWRDERAGAEDAMDVD